MRHSLRCAAAGAVREDTETQHTGYTPTQYSTCHGSGRIDVPADIPRQKHIYTAEDGGSQPSSVHHAAALIYAHMPRAGIPVSTAPKRDIGTQRRVRRQDKKIKNDINDK